MTNKKNVAEKKIKLNKKEYVLTVQAEDLMNGTVLISDVLGEIVKFTEDPNTEVSLFDLPGLPVSINVKGNVEPYTLETMPDDFTKKDVLAHNERIKVIEDFSEKVRDEFRYRLMADDSIIGTVVKKDYPTLNEKDVNEILSLARSTSSDFSDQIVKIDEYAEISTEVLKNHQK